MAKSLRDRAMASEMHSRFVAREDDLGHLLTDEEVKDEARYQLENLPYSGYEDAWIRKAMRQMRALLK